MSCKLPACDNCFQSLVHGLTSPVDCVNCVNWDLENKSDLLSFSPPDNYPKDALAAGSTNLWPKRITYRTLNSAVDISHSAIVTGQWSVDNAKSYLWVEGLNTDAISAVIECSTNVRAFNLLEAEKDMYANDYQSMVRDKTH